MDELFKNLRSFQKVHDDAMKSLKPAIRVKEIMDSAMMPTYSLLKMFPTIESLGLNFYQDELERSNNALKSVWAEYAFGVQSFTQNTQWIQNLTSKIEFPSLGIRQSMIPDFKDLLSSVGSISDIGLVGYSYDEPNEPDPEPGEEVKTIDETYFLGMSQADLRKVLIFILFKILIPAIIAYTSYKATSMHSDIQHQELMNEKYKQTELLERIADSTSESEATINEIGERLENACHQFIQFVNNLDDQSSDLEDPESPE